MSGSTLPTPTALSWTADCGTATEGPSFLSCSSGKVVADCGTYVTTGGPSEKTCCRTCARFPTTHGHDCRRMLPSGECDSWEPSMGHADVYAEQEAEALQDTMANINPHLKRYTQACEEVVTGQRLSSLEPHDVKQHEALKQLYNIKLKRDLADEFRGLSDAEKEIEQEPTDSTAKVQASTTEAAANLETPPSSSGEITQPQEDTEAPSASATALFGPLPYKWMTRLNKNRTRRPSGLSL